MKPALAAARLNERIFAMRFFALIRMFALTFFFCGALALHAAPNGWLENFDEARELARKQGKPLLLLFTGSDWCGFCILLEEETSGFKDLETFLKEKTVPVYLDFPTKKPMSPEQKKRNREIAERFRVFSYPTTMILSPDGGEIRAIVSGYEGKKEYLRALEFATNEAWTESLRKALAEPDRATRKKLVKDLCKDVPEALGDGVMYMPNSPF